MHAGFIIAVALAGATSASTPPGFEPASTSDLAVAFANVSAMNGIVVARAGKVSLQYLNPASNNSQTHHQRQN